MKQMFRWHLQIPLYLPRFYAISSSRTPVPICIHTACPLLSINDMPFFRLLSTQYSNNIPAYTQAHVFNILLPQHIFTCNDYLYIVVVSVREWMMTNAIIILLCFYMFQICLCIHSCKFELLASDLASKHMSGFKLPIYDFKVSK